LSASAQALSRSEKQARTRSSLLESAARVFARRGLEGASIDEVAADAGYTKGAFYANFAGGKEELLLAMLDERFEARLAEIERATAGDELPPDQARRAGADFIRAVASDPEWGRVHFELHGYATRNPAFREALVARNRELRERIAELLVARADAAGLEPTVAPERVAMMAVAMANGMAFERLVEPEQVTEDGLGEMMAIFFTGLLAYDAGAPPHSPAAP